MSADTERAAAAIALLSGQFERIHPERVASFLGEHPALIADLEDLHRELYHAFPGARFVLRHLSSPRVSSPAGDGHLLVVVVPAEAADDASQRLSALLRERSARSASVGSAFLVGPASPGIDPYADDDEALQCYIRRRSDDYRLYLDAAQRFVTAPPDSEERAFAATELTRARLIELGQPAEERGGDPRDVLTRLRGRHEAAADAD